MILKAADLFCISCRQRYAPIVKEYGQLRTFHRHAIQYKRQNYYEILGIPTNASKKDIKAAFVNLSKEHHPDKNPNNPHATHERFVKINKAYSTLVKPESRRRYDTSLAYRLHQEDVARSMARSHSYTGNGRPGYWADEGPDASRFHDEYIFHMRDRSKDAYYSQKPYYGFRGLNRMSNAAIVWACIGWLLLGCGIHFIVIGASSRRSVKIRDENDKKLHAHYMASKEMARIHGTDVQLSLLNDKAARSSIMTPGTDVKN